MADQTRNNFQCAAVADADVRDFAPRACKRHSCLRFGPGKVVEYAHGSMHTEARVASSLLTGRSDRPGGSLISCMRKVSKISNFTTTSPQQVMPSP